MLACRLFSQPYWLAEGASVSPNGFFIPAGLFVSAWHLKQVVIPTAVTPGVVVPTGARVLLPHATTKYAHVKNTMATAELNLIFRITQPRFLQ
jgi:hypothetical protein